MFSRFTRHNGKHTVFVRSDRIISLGDTEDGGCMVTWDGGDVTAHLTVDSSAQENLDRLTSEELAAIEHAQRQQQRVANGLPIVPVSRGRLR